MEALSALLPGSASTGAWDWGLRAPEPVPEPEPEPDPEPEREWADAERVLTVGDGDLSYSLNLLRTERRARREGGRRLVLVASTLDSRVELLRRYGPQVSATMAELDGGEDVRGELAGTGPVLSRFVPGVDATRLAATLGAAERGVGERGDATRRYRNRRGVHFLDWLLGLGPAHFDRIDWLFPHTGKQKIQTQRQLLRDFFVSAAPHLRPRGTIRVALAQGQGGTPMESVLRKPADSWQVVEAAAYGGLVLCAVAPFVAPVVATGRPGGATPRAPSTLARHSCTNSRCRSAAHRPRRLLSTRPRTNTASASGGPPAAATLSAAAPSPPGYGASSVTWRAKIMLLVSSRRVRDTCRLHLRQGSGVGSASRSGLFISRQPKR